jgi:uncharacterized protein YrrD
MDAYSEYFNNIVSRSWLGQKRNKTVSSIEQSLITDIYLEATDTDKVIIFGKTEKFYFIVEGFDSEGYCYGNGLFNDNMVDLISAYKNRDSITGGKDIEMFVATILLKTQLDKDLALKTEYKSTRPRKI